MSDRLTAFLEALGYSGQPFGMFYTDTEPESGFVPKEGAGLFPRDGAAQRTRLLHFVSELVMCPGQYLASPKERVCRLLRSQALWMCRRLLISASTNHSSNSSRTMSRPAYPANFTVNGTCPRLRPQGVFFAKWIHGPLPPGSVYSNHSVCSMRMRPGNRHFLCKG